MKRIRKKLTTLLLAVAIALTSLNAYTAATEVTGVGYKTYSIKGRSVLFEDDLVKRKELRRKVAEWITIDLRDVKLKFPERAYEKISKVAIWIDYTTDPIGGLTGHGAAYFPGPSFMLRHGWPLAKVGNIEIFNALEYVQWRGRYSGQVLVHELSHAYEQYVTDNSKKFRNELVKVFHRAKLSGKYQKVDYKGSIQKYPAYAMTNANEYFAELTEAYYGNNDYFPHNREQLKQFDPEGFALIEKFWNK